MKVQIVGKGRIGSFLAGSIRSGVGWGFLPWEWAPVEWAPVVLLALGEVGTLEWLGKYDGRVPASSFVVTNCSVKTRVDQVMRRRWPDGSAVSFGHLHVLFNPQYQQQGNVVYVGAPGDCGMLRDVLALDIQHMSGTAADHDRVMAVQQRDFQRQVIEIGSRLSAVQPTWRTASASKFLELYERIKSLGPEVLAEIAGNPQ